jgi:hypothetical protein
MRTFHPQNIQYPAQILPPKGVHGRAKKNIISTLGFRSTGSRNETSHVRRSDPKCRRTTPKIDLSDHNAYTASPFGPDIERAGGLPVAKSIAWSTDHSTFSGLELGTE